MHEQNASEAPTRTSRRSLGNIIWLSLFAALMLAAALVWLWPHSSLPTATGREVHSGLPWKHDSVQVKTVKGHWASAAGDERLSLRTAYYPVAEVELGDSSGSGMLYIMFMDDKRQQAGDTISLYYEKGSFRHRKELNIHAEGSKAHVFIETGYGKKTDFELHQVDESAPLWRIRLLYRPDGAADMQPLGFVTIPAKLHP